MQKKKINNPLEVTSIPVEDLADIPDRIESLGGYRQNISRTAAEPAGTLSEVIQKMRSKGNAVTNFANPKLKKALGIVPGVGAGIAALQGDPAMAAEELAQDAMGPAGMVYEALRPEVAGNPEEQAMFDAESDAYRNYQNSPAGQAAKFAKIRASLTNK